MKQSVLSSNHNITTPREDDIPFMQIVQKHHTWIFI